MTPAADAPTRPALRVRTSDAYWKQPLKWNRDAAAEGVRRRVFCASLADVFEDKPDQAAELSNWRLDLSGLILDTPWLDWLLLTKRPENVKSDWNPWPANVWIGTSIENQEYADKRIPELLKIPAAVRFLSCEPLLGPIKLPYSEEWFNDEAWANNAPPHLTLGYSEEPDNPINWVIVGGESGKEARPMHPEWARAIRDQCQDAGVPFFFKQYGEWLPVDARRLYKNYKRVDWSDGTAALRVGKHRAGRLLDGREWNEYPQTSAAMSGGD